MGKSRANSYQSSGRLLSVLGAIFGGMGEAGVEPNPQYGVVGPTESGEPLNNPKPFTAKNIFAKPVAAKYNNDFLARQQLAQLGEQYKIQAEQNLNPILVERQKGIGDVQNTQALDLDARRIPIKVKEEQELGAVRNRNQTDLDNSRVVTSRGILARPENIELYNSATSSPIISAIAAKANEEIAQGLAGASKAQIDQSLYEAAYPGKLSGVVPRVALENEQIASQRKLLPTETSVQEKLLRYKPEQVKSAIVTDALRPVGSEGLYDTSVGRIVVKPSGLLQKTTEMKNDLAAMKNAQAPTAPQTQPQIQPTESGDLVEVEINGHKVRIPRAALKQLIPAQ